MSGALDALLDALSDAESRWLPGAARHAARKGLHHRRLQAMPSADRRVTFFIGSLCIYGGGARLLVVSCRAAPSLEISQKLYASRLKLLEAGRCRSQIRDLRQPAFHVLLVHTAQGTLKLTFSRPLSGPP